MPYPMNVNPLGHEVNHLLLKCGTGVLVDATGKFDQEVFYDIARQCMEARISVTIVSSGAIRAGEKSMLGGGRTFFSHKEYAAVGTRYLMQAWGCAFMCFRIEVAQIWVTPVNMGHKNERGRISTAIQFCHRNRVVPIINENDVVSESWRGMDNDVLAAEIAELAHPDAILFLTKVGGVYEKHPARNPDARRYSEIDIDAARVLASDASTQSCHGHSGMGEKLFQAVRCVEMGMRVGIAGAENNNIRRFARGESVGTMIHQVAHNKEGGLS